MKKLWLFCLMIALIIALPFLNQLAHAGASNNPVSETHDVAFCKENCKTAFTDCLDINDLDDEDCGQKIAQCEQDCVTKYAKQS